MLQIILLILKILGLLLLGILGLILLVVLIFLVSPAVYRLEASGEDTMESVKGKLRFHWLLRLVSGEISYEDSALTWRLRTGWKRFGSDLENSSAGDAGARGEKLPKERKDETQAGQRVEQKAEQRAEKIQKQKKEPKNVSVGKAAVRQNKNSTSVGKPETKRAENAEGGQSEKKKNSLYERLKKFWKKIKYTFQKICDNIRSLVKKKERLSAFIQNEVHKSAFFKVIRELRRFLKTMLPKDADVHIQFGFTDPAVTGYVLALISMIYPFIGEYTEILPDFEHRNLRGRIYVKGRIRAIHAVSLALRVLMDKNVRTTYRHIRKFKL